MLAGLWEFPNEDKIMDAEDIKEWMAEHHMEDAKTKAAGKGKHIFSHVEWHMTAYLILIEDPQETGEYLFVEPEKTEEKYPIPAAFAAYARYMEIKLGQEKYREEL